MGHDSEISDRERIASRWNGVQAMCFVLLELAIFPMSKKIKLKKDVYTITFSYELHHTNL